MANFSFNGTISGLDTAGLITAMLAADQAPLSRIATQRTTLKSTQSAYGQLRSLLANLQTAGKAFTISSMAAKRSATSSAASVLTGSATAGTVPGAYSVSVGALATSTVAKSMTAIGKAISVADLGTALADLQLPGSVTAGTVGVVVDGVITRATIGSPATATLGDAINAIAAKLQEGIRAKEGTADAIVTATITGNKVEFTMTGAAASHAISFGAGGDTSNALGILGLTGMGVPSLANGSPLSARNVLGVVRTTSLLDAAGLTGLTSGAGTLTINGVAIAYDTTVDSLSAVVTRINSSAAGVTASLDRGNDKLLLTSRTGGAAPISIEDTIDVGNGKIATLAAALNLAPGTTGAQVVGAQSEVTVDGRTYLSDTNTVSSAIDGVTINLLTLGTSTLTVAPDSSSVSSAVSTLVAAYNALADSLAALTQNDPKLTRGSLASDTSARDLSLSLRQVLTAQTSLTGNMKSLADIGVTSGVVGSALGTTTRLQVNAAKLQAALESDPSAVADLLNGTSGAIAPLVDAVNAWTKTSGRLDNALLTITSTLKALETREASINARIAIKQAGLEKKFAALEKNLALLGTQSSGLTQQVTSMNKSSG